MTTPQKRYLFASDFDGTLFETFTPSPNGIDVREAYRRAILDILGPVGERLFETSDINSAPYELVMDLFRWHRQEPNWLYSTEDNHQFREKTYDSLTDKAYEFYQKQGQKIRVFIPEGKDNQLVWDPSNPLRIITQMVVARKLQYLFDEIGRKDAEGRMWPQPCEGTIDFLKTMESLRRQGMPIDTAIISSGHEAFIRKTLEVWGIEPPQVLVTDDDIRPRQFPEEDQRRFKPGQLPLAIAHREWLRQQNILRDQGVDFMTEAIDSKKRMVYVGDSIEKDGLMAYRGKIQGYLYPFTPLAAITNEITTKKELFDGRPIAEIFCRRKGNERVNSLLPDNLEGQFRSPRSREIR